MDSFEAVLSRACDHHMSYRLALPVLHRAAGSRISRAFGEDHHTTSIAAPVHMQANLARMVYGAGQALKRNGESARRFRCGMPKGACCRRAGARACRVFA